jgi:hypothetical protein
MTVSLIVNNPAQTISLDMNQEQPTQSLSLIIGSGTVSIARQPLPPTEMLLFGDSGLAIDFMLNQYAVKI